MKKSLLVLALAAASAAHAADDTITVALAGPETGPVTQYGTIQKIGAEAAIDFINANGGMNGKKIVAKSYDDACEPKTGGHGCQQNRRRRGEICYRPSLLRFYHACRRDL